MAKPVDEPLKNSYTDYALLRASPGFDGDFEAGEAIRGQTR